MHTGWHRTGEHKLVIYAPAHRVHSNLCSVSVVSAVSLPYCHSTNYVLILISRTSCNHNGLDCEWRVPEITHLTTDTWRENGQWNDLARVPSLEYWSHGGVNPFIALIINIIGYYNYFQRVVTVTLRCDMHKNKRTFFRLGPFLVCFLQANYFIIINFILYAGRKHTFVFSWTPLKLIAGVKCVFYRLISCCNFGAARNKTIELPTRNSAAMDS